VDAYQSYVGINQSKASNDSKINELSDGCGYYFINNVLPLDDIKKIYDDLISIEKEQFSSIGNDLNASEQGQVRSPFLSSEFIRNLLCSEIILRLIKTHLVGNGICHLLNGQIVRPSNNHNQSLWHRDFNKAHLSKPIMAFNTLFFLGEYKDINNFSTIQEKHRFAVIPGSQSSYGPPKESLLNQNKIISLNPGSILVFNSQLWHRVLSNKNNQLFLNIMFTEPFIKQQINLLGSTKEWLTKHSNEESELARLIGWWSRSPADIKEFRIPPNGIRSYRSGQG